MFRSWLLRIVTNACYDELRRRKRRVEVSLDGLVQEEDGNPDEVIHLPDEDGIDNPETRSERAALAQAIQGCLDRLPMEFRVAAVLVDVQGFDYEEAAQILDLPVGTIKSRLARARARLRLCLQEHRELLPAAYRLEDEVLT
jgi:RNA polymerase sigma-70 factor (ECF subfamily)